MRKRLCQALAGLEGRPLRAVIGFDGFVDEIVYAVDKRYSPTRYDRVPTLTEYGRRIAASSGLSSNVEIVSTYRKLGGNGPIFALGLKRYGAAVTYIGCTGEGTLHPVFEELAEGARVIGICDPGQTDAMEFEDGKLIRSKLEALNHLTWENILARLPAPALAELLDGARLISFNNWSMLPYMSDVWRHLLCDVLPLMREPKGDKIIFFDLADPQKREAEDILEALELIRSFKAAGFQTVLGLNKKEACEIAELAGHACDDYAAADLRELTEALADFLRIDCVVVHPTDAAACVRDGRYDEVKGPYCARPRLTTGAGDNFNAGFMFGYALGLEPELCLLLGTATSGYYVRQARSPDLCEVRQFLRRWEEEGLDALDQDKEE